MAAAAVKRAGYRNETLAKLTAESLVRNHTIAERLGVFTTAGLKAMREGKAAKVQRGPYKGQSLSVDHIIPRAVAPELDNVIANLELMPLQINESKNVKVGSRQKDLAKKFFAAGLISPIRLADILRR